MTQQDQITIDITAVEYDKDAKSGKIIGTIGESHLPWGKRIDITILLRAHNAVVAGPEMTPKPT